MVCDDFFHQTYQLKIERVHAVFFRNAHGFFFAVKLYLVEQSFVQFGKSERKRVVDDRIEAIRVSVYLVDAFGDEIVVNQEMVFVIIRIEYAVTAERYVRYHKVKGIVLKTGFFKPLDLYS